MNLGLNPENSTIKQFPYEIWNFAHPICSIPTLFQTNFTDNGIFVSPDKFSTRNSLHSPSQRELDTGYYYENKSPATKISATHSIGVSNSNTTEKNAKIFGDTIQRSSGEMNINEKQQNHKLKSFQWLQRRCMFDIVFVRF